MRSWPQWVHGELINWARWCWQGSLPHPLPPNRCTSLEGGYQTPTYDGSEADSPRIQPNGDYAQIVDRVWRRLPDGERLALRAAYPQRHASGYAEHGTSVAAKSIGQTRRDFEANLFSAVERVWREFQRMGLGE